MEEASHKRLCIIWFHSHEISTTGRFTEIGSNLVTEETQVALVVKSLPANAGDVRDVGSISGLGRSRGGGHGNPLLYSCLENSMERGSWKATVHRVSKSWTWLKVTACMHIFWSRDKQVQSLSEQPCLYFDGDVHAVLVLRPSSAWLKVQYPEIWLTSKYDSRK